MRESGNLEAGPVHQAAVCMQVQGSSTGVQHGLQPAIPSPTAVQHGRHQWLALIQKSNTSWLLSSLGAWQVCRQAESDRVNDKLNHARWERGEGSWTIKSHSCINEHAAG